LVAVEYHGETYVVSMLGEGSEWVQNVRAASGRAQLKRGNWRDVILNEMPVDERAPILKAWSDVATSGRKHLPFPHTASLESFRLIAPEYPVFRIDRPEQIKTDT